MKASSLAIILALTSLVTAHNAEASAPVRVKALKTLDGQVMRCDHRADNGRVAYRITGQRGLIKAGNVEVTIEFETLKCVEQSGVLAFEKARLDGRLVNSLNGFIEFSNLELIAYTPDFNVVKAKGVQISGSQHSVTFVAPVDKFVGLYRRNANANGGRRVSMITFLRGWASLGDARTGKVIETTLTPFGAYNVFLSEEDNTLAFAGQLAGPLDPL